MGDHWKGWRSRGPLLVTLALAVGCSTSAKPRAGGFNPCVLVTPAQVSTGFSVQFGAGKAIVAAADGYDNCRWEGDDPDGDREVDLRVASDQSLKAHNPSSAAAAYRAEFTSTPRWHVKGVPGLGDAATVAWFQAAFQDPSQAASNGGLAQLDVLSGTSLITVSYNGPAYQSAEVEPALETLARDALRVLRARGPVTH
jgi:hypothetical protein